MATLASSGAKLVAVLGAGESTDGLLRAAGMSLHETWFRGGSRACPCGDRWIVLSGEGVAAGRCRAQPWDGRGHLIFSDCPRWRTFCGPALLRAALAPGWVVHLAYDERLVEATRKHLERRYPGKDSLRWVYRAMRAAAGPGGVLPPPNVIAARMSEHWPGLVDEAGVTFGLEVFEQSGLVARDNEGRPLLVPTGGRQVDVAASVRYNDGVKTKQLFGAYSRIALEATPARLIALAAERSSLDGLAGTDSGSAGLSEAGS